MRRITMGQFRYIHTYGYIILQRLVGKQYLRSIRCKADRMTAAVDLKLKLHVCLIYYNSQM